MKPRPTNLLLIAVLTLAGCGDDEEDVAPPAVVGLPGPAGGARGAVEWKADLAGVAIPDQAASGSIRGRSFTVEKAVVEQRNILKLRQGADFFADVEVVLFLFVDPPLAGQRIVVPREEFGGSPHVHLSILDEGKGMPDTEMHTDGYSMILEFDAVDGLRLPGRIYLCVDDEEKTVVAGTFVVELPAPPPPPEDDFDASADSLRTLQLLATKDLKNEHGAALEIKDFDTRYLLPRAGRQTGTSIVRYAVGGVETRRTYRFEKTDGIWRIAGRE